MINFSQKYSNILNNTHEQANGISEKYSNALKRIEHLERELNQRKEAEAIMTEGMKNCTASLCFVETQLHAISRCLDQSNKQITELIQENNALKLSSDQWANRAIKLEFDGLTVKDELKKIESERDLAVNKIAQLQVELITALKENIRNKN